MKALRFLLLPLLLTPLAAGPAGAGGKLYWCDASGGRVLVADPDGGNSQVLIPGLEGPVDVAIDAVGGKMYIADNGFFGQSILRANLDGTGLEEIVPQAQAGAPSAIAVDPAGGKVYWIEGATDDVRRANLDGTASETILATTATSIAIDPVGGHLYCTATGFTPQVVRTALDGSNPEVLASGVNPLHGIALDPGGDRMYWIHGFTELWRADLDGTNAAIVYTSDLMDRIALDLVDDRMYVTYVLGFGVGVLDIDGGGTIQGLPLSSLASATVHHPADNLRKVYWSEDGPERIREARLDGSAAADLFTANLLNVYDLAVDPATGRMAWVDWQLRDVRIGDTDGTDDTTVLDNAGLFLSSVALDAAADWIYYRNSESFYRVHSDGTGLQSLGNINGGVVTGGGGDLALDPLGGMIYATHFVSNMLVRFPADSGAVDTLSVGISPSCVTVDPMGGKVYWTNNETILRADLDGAGAEFLFTADAVPTEVALDTEAGKIYWLRPDAVWRANLDGTNRRRLVGGLVGARGLALNAAPAFQHKVYWSDLTNDRIERSNLDGSAVEVVIGEGLGGPQGIAFDATSGKMYWTDPSLDVIRRANLDGTEPEDVLTTGLNYARDIDIDGAGGKVYWVDRGLHRVGRVDTDGTNFEILYTGIDDPKGMELDVDAGKIYWGDNTTNRIARGDMDGSGPVETVVSATPHPYGIALDVATGMIYWTDDVDDTIERANLDGTGREVLHSGFVQPLHLAIDHAEGKLYWAENDRDEIMRSDLDGANLETIVSRPGGGLLGIFLTTPDGLPSTGAPVVAAPAPLRLLPPSPNPFTSRTSLAVTHGGGELELDVFDVTGRRVRTIAHARQPAGDYVWTWDGRDGNGRRTAPGVYFFRYRDGDGGQRTVKGVLLR